MAKPTQVQRFISDLGAGSIEHMLAQIISDVADGVVNTGKKGEATLKLTFSSIGDSRQVRVEHKLTYKEPTRKGSRSEEHTTETPMYVNLNGTVTIVSEDNELFDATTSQAYGETKPVVNAN
ncbi:hypothetical protein [Moraxella canis]|uniref:Phage protein n=1 Tax=Moraxella canis TaxID=90239 RepID=A0A1S9ZK42_9GAMM|nr:hypothetical protein [Moraxella canis]OOR83895.1 hypothetical protein B0180_05490 [Moraxella canis]